MRGFLVEPDVPEVVVGPEILRALVLGHVHELWALDEVGVRVEAVVEPRLHIPSVNNIRRNNVDVRFVLLLGAKVNINKCRVSIVNTELAGWDYR